MTITTAKSTADLQGILDLQKANLPANISAEEKAEQGFVTVQHTIESLQQLADVAPQIIAKEEENVIGYTLAMSKELAPFIPVLQPMFQQLENIEYKGKMVAEYTFIVCGQACIDKDHRGKGLVKDLYEAMKNTLENDYDICVTEIAKSNVRSLKAHAKAGFEEIFSFNDGKEDWIIVLWDWKK